MESKILDNLIQNGPFAVLFCWLLFKVMKDSKEREARLTDLIERTLCKLGEDICAIKEKIGL